MGLDGAGGRCVYVCVCVVVVAGGGGGGGGGGQFFQVVF